VCVCVCVCVCLAAVTLYRWQAHFSQKSKLNGSSIMRICDWDSCLCHAPCIRVCACTCVCHAHMQGVWRKDQYDYASAVVCARVHTEMYLCVLLCMWRPLVFAYAMINGLHWAVQPCMFLGLSFYAVSN